MPSGGSSPIGLIEELQNTKFENSGINWFEKSYENAKKHGMDHEWLDWFLGGDKQGMTIPEACLAATIEWDL